MNFNFDLTQFGLGSFVKPSKDKKIIVPPIRRQTNRKQQTTSEWRDAILQAEHQWYPYRTRMIELYQDTILNAQVWSCMERRKDLTLLRDWHMVKPSGVEDTKAYDILNKLWFKKFLNYSLDAVFYGYTMIQMGSIIDNEFPHLQIARREFVSPDKNMILDYPSTPAGQDITEPKYKNWNILIQTINNAGVSSTGYGLLYPVGLLEIHLRNLLGYNADFLELFTQPFRLGKTDKTTEEERDFLEESLSQFGSNGWALLDKDDSIEFLDTKGGNNYQAYTDLEHRLEQKISKIILGHADALDSTPGKLGSGSNEDNPVAVALRDKRNIDAAFIENIINNELIPRMNALGFNIKSKFEFKNDDEERDETTYMAELSGKLSMGGLQMGAEFFTEKTKIPVREIYPDVSGATDTTVGGNEQGKVATPPPAIPPSHDNRKVNSKKYTQDGK
jgi:phage gp29-like protein